MAGKQKKSLYTAFLEKKELEKKNDMQQFNNREKTSLLLLFALDIFSKIIKIFFYIAVIIILTIGATVLLNSGLREDFIELFGNTF